MQVHCLRSNASLLSRVSRARFKNVRSHSVHREQANICGQAAEFIRFGPEVDKVMSLNLFALRASTIVKWLYDTQVQTVPRTLRSGQWKLREGLEHLGPWSRQNDHHRQFPASVRVSNKQWNSHSGMTNYLLHSNRQSAINCFHSLSCRVGSMIKMTVSCWGFCLF